MSQQFTRWIVLALLPIVGCGRCLPTSSQSQSSRSIVMTEASKSSIKAQPNEIATAKPHGVATRSPKEPPTPADQNLDPAEQERISKYVVGIGDQLEVIYSESWAIEGSYLLLPGDRVKVEYLHLFQMDEEGDAPNPVAASGLDRDVLISPDGKVALPYIGAVDAAGLTVTEMADRLNAKYQEYYLEPKMLVTLLSTGARLTDLREAIKASGSRLVVVAPDGTINLPHVGIVPAADLTMGELQTELAERYRRTAVGFAVTIRLVSPAGQSTRAQSDAGKDVPPVATIANVAETSMIDAQN